MVRQVPRSLGELRVLRVSGARSGERHAQPVEAACHASRVLRQVTVIVPERHDVILPGDSCPRRARAVAHGLTPEPRCLPGPRGRATDRTICSWEWGPRPLLGAPVSPPLPRRDIGAHRELLQDGHDEPAYAERKVLDRRDAMRGRSRAQSVSYTHLRAHETGRNLVCRLLL